jgi:hypothetical protein
MFKYQLKELPETFHYFAVFGSKGGVAVTPVFSTDDKLGKYLKSNKITPIQILTTSQISFWDN